jgi:hypothetical protein
MFSTENFKTGYNFLIFMSREEYLKDLLKWVSSDNLLVIDKSGKLRRVYCPFWVICLVDFPDIASGEKVPVDAIKLTVEVKEVYVIRGIHYYIIYFKIILE